MCKRLCNFLRGSTRDLKTKASAWTYRVGLFCLYLLTRQHLNFAEDINFSCKVVRNVNKIYVLWRIYL